MICKCPMAVNVFNGVCGGCLMPLDHSPREEGGSLIKTGKSRLKELESEVSGLRTFLKEIRVNLVKGVRKNLTCEPGCTCARDYASNEAERIKKFLEIK